MISLTRLPAWAKLGCGTAASPARSIAPAASLAGSFCITSILSTHKRANGRHGSSHPFRQSDGDPATGTDRRCQYRIADRTGSTRLASGVAMLEFLGTKPLDISR